MKTGMNFQNAVPFCINGQRRTALRCINILTTELARDKRKMKKRTYLIIITCLLTALIAIALIVNDLSVHVSDNENNSAVKRLDEDGYLYYMYYTKDYYGPEVIDAMRKIGYVDPGCSVFCTHNLEGEPITCRNYDFAHPVSEDDPTVTGLNIVLHCRPKDKYESIAIADAVWCDRYNPLLQKGGPDKQGFDPALLDILPYQCMDGINEKGLYISVQRVDIKEGDEPPRFPAGSSMLLRFILDDCANVDEAIRKTETNIIAPGDWQGCHFMVSDATGRSVVIESRNSEVKVIPSDICMNFYLGSDDMEDSYRNGKLREEAVRMTDEAMMSDYSYSYGYGHGYHRFVTILGQLECYKDTAKEEYYTRMPESTALVILRSVVQNAYTKAAGTSMTQYSIIYNNVRKTLEVWPFQNYAGSFEFDVKGNRISADK